MTTLTEQELAQRVEALVASETLQPVIEALKVSTFNSWMASEPDDTRGREALYQRALGLDMLLTSMTNIASENARQRQERQNAL